MSSESSWTYPSGHDDSYCSQALIFDQFTGFRIPDLTGLPYTSYYDVNPKIPSTALQPSLGPTNVVVDKQVWSLERITALNWHLDPPLSNVDSYPVTPEALATASPALFTTISQSIFPTFTEPRPPTPWESATSSPLLVSLTTGREPSPSPILVTVPPITTENLQPSHKAQLVPPDFIHNCFPLDHAAHAEKRKALELVMTADWKIRNQMEPHECYLLDFMRLDSQRNRWTCTFYTGGVPCGSSYKKKDQAKGHIRFHLQHFPYACLDAGPCPIKPKLCRKRYCAAEPRQKHRAIKTRCSFCNKPMLRGNVKRHRETACTQQMTNTSSPESFSPSSPPHD